MSDKTADKPCKTCGGSGYIGEVGWEADENWAAECPDCQGTGKAPDQLREQSSGSQSDQELEDIIYGALQAAWGYGGEYATTNNYKYVDLYEFRDEALAKLNHYINQLTALEYKRGFEDGQNSK